MFVQNRGSHRKSMKGHSIIAFTKIIAGRIPSGAERSRILKNRLTHTSPLHAN